MGVAGLLLHLLEVGDRSCAICEPTTAHSDICTGSKPVVTGIPAAPSQPDLRSIVSELAGILQH
jgi:hypothetical protein